MDHASSFRTAMAAAAAALLSALAPSVARAAEVGVSLSVAEPGVYGRVDIGQFPGPVLEQAQPIVVRPAAVAVEPMYLWVPPDQRLHWARYCANYRACGAPVYFVQDAWYREHVLRGHERRVDRREDRRGDRREDRREDRRDDRP